MPVRMTPAQLKALGVDPGRVKVRMRRTAKGPYHTLCTTCSEEFHTQASEDRHLKETRHLNYRLVWGH